MTLKKFFAVVIALGLILVAGAATYLFSLASNLPKMFTLADYEPLLVSEVFDRNDVKIGEFYREKRILVPYEQIPKHVIQAFVSAEDDKFFEHGGINYQAIVRATLANIKAGKKVQGGSTITQQVARSLLLSREKTYTRKIKEIFLSYKMEKNLTKENILWLYLNQIYLGQGAYGVGIASQIYFRKPLKDITIGEAAILAGLPQAPSRYSPIYNPTAAKHRQRYVLKRMAEEGYISEEIAEKEIEKPLKVYVKEDFKEVAPFYLETVRQLLVDKLGEEQVLDKGIKIQTSLDIKKQTVAQEQVAAGLRELDKRQGYRGPLKNVQDPKEIASLLLETRNKLVDEVTPVRMIQADGTIPQMGPLNLTGKDEAGHMLPNLPTYINLNQIVTGLVTQVDDQWGLVTVRFAEGRGLIDLETMNWARKPNPELRTEQALVKKPSDVLKKGDVILVKVAGKKFESPRIQDILQKEKAKITPKSKTKWVRPAELPIFEDYVEVELEQEPLVEGSLVSIDQSNFDLVSLVGGYDFSKSQFNRALQAARQTGSSFKTFVYAAALDKGFTPATPIIDAPIVFEEEDKSEEGQDVVAPKKSAAKGATEEEPEMKKWKPMNHSKKFAGDILFRNAFIRSLNVPTVKIVEKVGVDRAAQYARRLGIFSPLNMDFTLALGSSGVTLYEMTKAFSEINRLGKRVRPMLVHKVTSTKGETLLENLSLDERFTNELSTNDQDFEKRRQAYLAYKKAHPESANGAPAEPEAAPANPDATQTSLTKAQFEKEPPLYFDDPEQLIKPQTAFVITSLLQGVIDDPRGTGGAARGIGRPAAGKTGTTSGYYDAWFIGFTPDYTTGVWVGFDDEKTLGRGEVGGKAALPIWLEYMKSIHQDLPARGFTAPDGIVFANIDNKTGKLGSSNSEDVVRQAFVEGTEPNELQQSTDSKEDRNFYKEELQE